MQSSYYWLASYILKMLCAYTQRQEDMAAQRPHNNETSDKQLHIGQNACLKTTTRIYLYRWLHFCCSTMIHIFKLNNKSCCSVNVGKHYQVFMLENTKCNFVKQKFMRENKSSENKSSENNGNWNKQFLSYILLNRTYHLCFPTRHTISYR